MFSVDILLCSEYLTFSMDTDLIRSAGANGGTLVHRHRDYKYT